MVDSVLASGPLTIASQVVTQTNTNVQQSREALKEQIETPDPEGPAINAATSRAAGVQDSEGSSLNGNGPGGGNADTGGSTDPQKGKVVNTAA